MRSLFRLRKMLRAFTRLLLIYFALGTFMLPQSDFSILLDLPSMYRHCKATEDKDMDFIDFITDHLINIDGIFDKHHKGDDQLPHTPFPYHTMESIPFLSKNDLQYEITKPQFVIKTNSPTLKNSYSYKYVSSIFHPPLFN